MFEGQKLQLLFLLKICRCLRISFLSALHPSIFTIRNCVFTL